MQGSNFPKGMSTTRQPPMAVRARAIPSEQSSAGGAAVLGRGGTLALREREAPPLRGHKGATIALLQG